MTMGRATIKEPCVASQTNRSVCSHSMRIAKAARCGCEREVRVEGSTADRCTVYSNSSYGTY